MSNKLGPDKLLMLLWIESLIETNSGSSNKKNNKTKKIIFCGSMLKIQELSVLLLLLFTPIHSHYGGFSMHINDTFSTINSFKTIYNL